MLKPYYNIENTEAGCDEAGRGCLAGPVVAAAVILPKNYSNELLNDSKKISKKNRDFLRKQIENDAIDYTVEFIDHTIIDEINILNASIFAMRNAVLKLKVRPDFLLIDGNKFDKSEQINYKCIVKGDGIYASIAAASILAKTHRDEYMTYIAQKFPNYFWENNKGYPTKKHKEAIVKYGITEYHRKSFKLMDKQLKLF